jgi:hypothetical protein
MGFFFHDSVLLWGYRYRDFPFFLWVGYKYEKSVLGGVAMIRGISSVVREESYFKGMNVTSIFPAH